MNEGMSSDQRKGRPVDICDRKKLVIVTPCGSQLIISADTNNGHFQPRLDGPPGTAIRYEKLTPPEDAV